MANPIVLDFHGSFSWTAADHENSVFYSKMAEEHGIYMGTFQAEQEHFEKQMAGQYSVYYTERLRRGDPDRYAWSGLFGSTKRKDISNFLCPDILQAKLEHVRQVWFFLAPLDRSHQELERIEAAISASIEKQGGLAAGRGTVSI